VNNSCFSETSYRSLRNEASQREKGRLGGGVEERRWWWVEQFKGRIADKMDDVEQEGKKRRD